MLAQKGITLFTLRNLGNLTINHCPQCALLIKRQTQEPITIDVEQMSGVRSRDSVLFYAKEYAHTPTSFDVQEISSFRRKQGWFKEAIPPDPVFEFQKVTKDLSKDDTLSIVFQAEHCLNKSPEDNQSPVEQTKTHVRNAWSMRFFFKQFMDFLDSTGQALHLYWKSWLT